MTENEIAKIVVDAAIEVHRTLGGPGLLETVYAVRPQPGGPGPPHAADQRFRHAVQAAHSNAHAHGPTAS